MTLKEFVNKTILENNLQFKVDDVVDNINKKAKEYLGGKNGAIDDETIKNWIINYKPDNVEVKETEEEIKPIENHKIVKPSWEMESLL